MTRSTRSPFRSFFALPSARRTRTRFARPRLEELEPRRVLAPMIYDVTSTLDDGGTHELRWAINQHNMNMDPGDSITFHIGMGSKTIKLAGAALPAITTKVLIDGTTQGGFSTTPLIFIDTSQVTGDGLDIKAGGCTVQGLIIGNFNGDGIWLEKSNDANVIKTCWIGLDPTGEAAAPNQLMGIRVDSSNNSIGAGAPGSTSGCVISGNNGTGLNSGNGILIDGLGVTNQANNNVVTGCYIGTDMRGTGAIPNSGDGIKIMNDASSNTVGGGLGLATIGNVISGNTGNGVEITDPGTNGNVVKTNLIGLTKNGNDALANGGDGVFITGGAASNTVGGLNNVGANAISGNTGYGVHLDSDLSGNKANHNSVAGNYIGLQIDGASTQANQSGGVYISGGANANTIGGGGGVGTGGSGNVISGNKQAGVKLNGVSSNLVHGNYIGTDKGGTLKVGNDVFGVLLKSSSNNTIGSVGGAPSNVISANGFGSTGVNNGMGISLQGSSSNTILGNYIGTDKNGTAQLGNRTDGISDDGTSGSNAIGIGGMLATGNISSANGGYGINMIGSNNTIQSNKFGLDKNGNQLPNTNGGAFMGGSGNTWMNNQFQAGGAPIGLSLLQASDVAGIRLQVGDALLEKGNKSSLSIDQRLFRTETSPTVIGWTAPGRVSTKPPFDYLSASGIGSEVILSWLTVTNLLDARS